MQSRNTFASGVILTLVVLTIFLNIFSLSLPLFSMQVFDRVLTTGSTATLSFLLLIVSCIVVFQALIDGARSVMLSRLTANMEKRAIIAGLEGLGPPPTNPDRVDLSDLELFRSGPLLSTAAAICDAPWCLVFICAMFLLHQVLGWFTVASLLIVIVITIFGHRRTALQREVSAGEYGQALEAVRRSRNASSELRALGVSAVFLEAAMQHFAKATSVGANAAEVQAWLEAALRAVRTALQLILLAIAAVLVLQQSVQTGTIVAASMLFARALLPAERFVGVLPYILRLWRSRVRAHSTTPESPLPKVALPPLRGHVEIVSASVVGPDGRMCLNIANLAIEPGQLAVVVGDEGAGKSALLKAIVGVLPLSHGYIRIDGSAIGDYDSDHYSRQIGYLAENCDLGAGTVSSMISRMRATDDRSLIDACKLAGAHRVVQRLPQGYQTMIGDGRLPPLSHGQKKKIALARAFYLRPRLIVLDDPLAGLDDDGERMVLSAITELNTQGSTIVVASRHPRLTHVADRLIMLTEGQISLDCTADQISQLLSPRLAVSIS